MQLFGTNRHLNSDDLPKLLEKAVKGERRAQKAIYDSLSGKMYAVCLRYMGDSQAAQDVLQDGFVQLFTKLDSYSGEGSFEGWARKIFVNTALMCLRKRDILRDADDVGQVRDLTVPDPGPIQKIAFQDLMKMIAELPPGFRTVFNMYVIEGYSHKEIAEELGISENTSRSQLQRARSLLQSKIKEYDAR